MRNTIVLLSIGAVLGAIFSIVGVYYFYETSAARFISAWLSEQERISIEAFNVRPPTSSISTQANYLLYLEKAKDEGVISASDYHRGATLANIRLCLNYEELEEPEKASKVCKWASDHLSKWRSEWNVGDLKQWHRESKAKREIPEFSLKIISQMES